MLEDLKRFDLILKIKNLIYFKNCACKSCFTSTKFSKKQSTNSSIKIMNCEITVTGSSMQEFFSFLVWGMGVFGNLHVCVDVLIMELSMSHTEVEKCLK